VNNEQIIRRSYEVAEKQDIKGWVECFTPDGTFTNMSVGVTYRGPDGPTDIGKPVEVYAKAFPDMHRELYRFFSTGDVVIVELALQGTHKGPMTTAAWGFAPETATHALRIVYGGIFDRFPTAKLVLGHLGESLPFLAWRIQHGINFSPNGRSTKKRLIDYLAENIWVTTSGNFNTQALHCTMLTMGADRILFSNDYPYEDYAEGVHFIENVAIGESDRRKIPHSHPEE
jgi:predicted TIM-barrel fold metal-dependent hydrolase